MSQLYIDVLGICGLKCTENEEFHSEDYIDDYSEHNKGRQRIIFIVRKYMTKTVFEYN